MNRINRHTEENDIPIRLVIVNQYFHPDQTALSQIITDLTIGLSERNYGIDIVCSRHTQIDTTEFPRSFGSKVMVRNVGGTRFGKSTILGRFIDYISFYIFATIAVLKINKTALIMTTTAPPLIGLVGVLVKRIHRCKFVYNIQDLYPHTAIALGILKNKMVISFFEYLLNIILRSADHIITIGEDMKRQILSMNKEVHISVIHNWADGEKIYPVPPQKNLFIANNGYQNKFIVLYSGNFGMAHSFAIFLEAAQKLLTVPDIIFVFIGDGKQKDYIVRTVNEWGLSNVAIRYYEPPELLHYSLSSAHIGLISLARGLEGYIVPSKVYSMMAAGLSILYSGDSNSTVAKIIESAQCGYRVDQNDSEELVRHIYSQYNDRVLNDTLKKNARKYFEQHFERELAIEMYDATFRQILNDNGEKTYT